MYVHILEDNLEQRKYLTEIIERNRKEQGYHMQIGIVESNPEFFLEELEKNFNEPEIFFISIDLESELTGFDVCKKIREWEKERELKSNLFCMSARKAQMSLTFQYKLSPLDYINKNNLSEMQVKIAECLEKIENSKEYITFTIHKKETKVRIKDIKDITISEKRDNINIVTEHGFRNIPFTKEVESKLLKHGFIIKKNK